MSERATRGLKSPAVVARIAGALWLVSVVTGIYAEVFVRGAMIVHGNAPATASKILAGEPVFRTGFAADLIGDMAYLVATLLLASLLKPVNRTITLITLGFGVAGSAVMAANLINLMGPLILLHTIDLTTGPSVFTPLILLFLRLHSLGYSISIALFSIQVGSIGYLLLRSRFFPRFFGILFMIEAVCNMISSFGGFLDLAWVEHLGTYILLPGLPAEVGFPLWLLLVGTDSARWSAAVELDRGV